MPRSTGTLLVSSACGYHAEAVERPGIEIMVVTHPCVISVTETDLCKRANKDIRYPLVQSGQETRHTETTTAGQTSKITEGLP